ncbi:MAG: nitroreductase family protein, partial [Gammaproteobacteria bacterium]
MLFKMEQRGIKQHENADTISLPILLSADAKSSKSHREYLQDPIPLERFSRFLGLLSCRKSDSSNGSNKYNYGSAGGLYPVQTYVHVQPSRIEGLAAGLYYYHPKNHQLQFISLIDIDEGVHYSHNRKTVRAGAFSLYMFGDLDAIVPLYGEIGRDMCFLAAGAMCQLLRTHGPDYGIGTCQIGHFQFAPVENGFKLSKNQILLTSLIGGSVVIETTLQSDAAVISLKQFKEGLAGYLEASLPQHMRPARIVVLSAFPVTANGKV